VFYNFLFSTLLHLQYLHYHEQTSNWGDHNQC
jgi:hypothetical protein